MVTPVVTADWGGRPLSELERLIDRRIVQLGESTEDALYATASRFLRSLRPMVKVAKLSKGERSFTLEDTGLVIGKYQGEYHPHTRFMGDYRTDIKPIVMWGGGYPKHTVHVYKATPTFGARMTWRHNAHKGCWYIAAYSADVAKRCAERMMRRAVDKFRGLARTSVTAMLMETKRAMGRMGDARDELRADAARGFSARRIEEAASNMAWATFRTGARYAELTMGDNLDYIGAALKGGESAISLALMKAANSTAGYLRSKTGDLLDPSIETPFPEIARHRG